MSSPVSDVAWGVAQAEELSVWLRTTASAADVLTEIAEVAAFAQAGVRAGIGQPSSVLDVGVGPLGISLAPFVGAARFVAIDSLPILDVRTGVSAVDRLVEELRQGGAFHQIDATRRLPFEDAEFDLVACDNVIDHTQDPARVLRECRRVVQPHGHLLFGVNVFSAAGLVRWRHVTRRLHPRDPNVLCHPHSFLAPAVRDLLRQTGWEPVDLGAPNRRTRLVGRSFRYRALCRPR